MCKVLCSILRTENEEKSEREKGKLGKKEGKLERKTLGP
jgi:hypothetical protein